VWWILLISFVSIFFLFLLFKKKRINEISSDAFLRMQRDEKGDGTAKCRDCGELADVTETGAARAHLGHAP